MVVLKNRITEILNNKKTLFLIVLFFVILITIAIPSLARYKNRINLQNIEVWNGEVATSFKSGTGSEEEPYVISNGSELAFLSEQLKTEDYTNKYFEISSDIVLNNGVFNNDETNGITYTIDNVTYYVLENSNVLYTDIERKKASSKKLNILTPLDNFKGTLNGKSNIIYGLYITGEEKQLGLFTNLSGTLSNLYVENSLVYGGSITGGLASSAEMTTINNTLFNGFVIGNKTNSQVISSNDITSQMVNVTENIKHTIPLTNSNEYTEGEVTSSKLTGTCIVESQTAETNITINGSAITAGAFEIDLGTTILNELTLEATSTEETTITLTNLKYDITYDSAVTAGIVAQGNNLTIKNVINKSYVSGNMLVSGIVGSAKNYLNINQTYNTKEIVSGKIASGIVGQISYSSTNSAITNSYNSGDLIGPITGGIIGNVINTENTIKLENVFNTSNNYPIGNDTTFLEIINSYTIAKKEEDNNFVPTTIDVLQNQTFPKTTLQFNEFVDSDDLKTNNNNVWIYEEDRLPILYIDDITNPIAEINMNAGTWNNYSQELKIINLTGNITFNITALNELRPIKEVYYYIEENSIGLSKKQLEKVLWTNYTDITKISEQGVYVVYAKVIDNNDNITYMNTDILVLDLSGSEIQIKMGDKTWKQKTEYDGYYYITEPKQIEITSQDLLSGITSNKYYISNKFLTKEELNNIEETTWTEYTKPFTINKLGNNIVYAKVTDSMGVTAYANTDNIIYNGYQETMSLGINGQEYTTNSITDKSSITFNFKYTDENPYSGTIKHVIKSNVLLPVGTSLTLIDNNSKKIYKLEITTEEDLYNYASSCSDENCEKLATYSLEQFKEVGKSQEVLFDETLYSTETINENFTLIVDFAKKANTLNYENVKIYMESSDKDYTRITLPNTMKTFNIYNNIESMSTKPALEIKTTSNSTVELNSDSVTNIDISALINYTTYNNNKIIDTTLESQQIGLKIQLIDESGNIVSKEKYKNLTFKVGENQYYPNNENTIYIDTNTIKSTIIPLQITSLLDNTTLEEGTYYFEVEGYTSYDSTTKELGSTEKIKIPVTTTSNIKNNYTFDVQMEDTKRIIDKKDKTINLEFNIIEKGAFKNPNIRISMYQKDNMTAYNQDYTLVDLKTYTSDNLKQATDKIYYAVENPIKYRGTSATTNKFNLNLNTTNMQTIGYKIVFELYDGDKLIGIINKKILVR